MCVTYETDMYACKNIMIIDSAARGHRDYHESYA